MEKMVTIVELRCTTCGKSASPPPDIATHPASTIRLIAPLFRCADCGSAVAIVSVPEGVR